jgi:diguanylate cyclase (GGDEF)-like protein/PAS domain S-box-containing protein
LFGLPSAHDARSGDGMDLAQRATEELRAVADLMTDAQRVANFGSWEWRVAADEVYWSEQLYRIFGIEEGDEPHAFQVTFTTYLDRVHPDEQDMVRGKIEAALGDVKPFRFEHRIVRPDGQFRSVRCQGEPILDSKTKQVVRVVGVCQDITEMAEVEHARSEADARFRSAFENAPIGIALVDFSDGPDGRLTEVNRALQDLTSRTTDELIGRTLTGLCLAEDAAIDEAQRERLVAGEIERFTVEKRALLHEDDRLVWLELSVSTIPLNDGPRQAGIVHVQDVTERKHFEEQLRYIADHDSLTGLMNRRRFREELDSQLALRRRYGGAGALLLVDVDRLKSVNDTRGHGAGDIVLRRVAEAMRGRFRSTDVLARLAGDEFAVLLPSAEGHQAVVLAEALISRLAQDEVASWGVSASIGIAPFGENDKRTTEEVMATADAAMYRSKQRGGAVAELAETPPSGSPHSRTEDRIETVLPRRSMATDPFTAPRAAAELTVADRVRAALDHDQLLLYGQPVIDLRSGRVAHHELLVRMRDKQGKVLAASDFLGAAAQTEGVCSAVDAWVVEHALAMLTNGSRGARFQMNLSGETLNDDRGLDDLISKVATSSIDEDSLGFEIGETSIQRDFDRASLVLDRLAKAGCSLVIDGFSAGFGSFEYLQRLPVRQIKIDGVVVRSLLAEPDYATIRAIVRLAQGLSKSTVAKLVDSSSVIPMLRMHGVDMAQGYEVGKPVPLAA